MMQAAPEEIPAVFLSYRQRLHAEKEKLEQVLSVADSISAEELSSQDTLVSQLEPIAASVQLPASDIHPNFRYLDLMEANLMNAAMYAAFSTQNSSSANMAVGGKGGGMDIGNAQKIAAYNLLMNDRD